MKCAPPTPKSPSRDDVRLHWHRFVPEILQQRKSETQTRFYRYRIGETDEEESIHSDRELDPKRISPIQHEKDVSGTAPRTVPSCLEAKKKCPPSTATTDRQPYSCSECKACGGSCPMHPTEASTHPARFSSEGTFLMHPFRDVPSPNEHPPSYPLRQAGGGACSVHPFRDSSPSSPQKIETLPPPAPEVYLRPEVPLHPARQSRGDSACLMVMRRFEKQQEEVVPLAHVGNLSMSSIRSPPFAKPVQAKPPPAQLLPPETTALVPAAANQQKAVVPAHAVVLPRAATLKIAPPSQLSFPQATLSPLESKHTQQRGEFPHWLRPVQPYLERLAPYIQRLINLMYRADPQNIKFYSTIIVMFFCFYMGALGLSVTWIAAMSFALYGAHKRRLVFRRRFQDFLQAERLESRDDTSEKWSEVEESRWLNGVLRKFWSTYEDTFNALAIDNLQPLVNSNKPPQVTEIVIAEFKVGSRPPKLYNLRWHKTKSSYIMIDAEAHFVGKIRAVLQARFAVGTAFDIVVPVRVTIREIKVRIRIKYRLAHRDFAQGPLWFSLASSPVLQYDIKPLAHIDVMDAPGFGAWIRDLILSSVDENLRWPKQICIYGNEKIRDLEARSDVFFGTLRVHVIEAKDLRNTDMWGASDPFAILRVGPFRFQSSIIKDDLTPKWNETVRFPLDQRVVWPTTLHIRLRDYDRFGPDRSLGECEIDLAELDEGKLVDRWLKLRDTSTGQVHVKLQLEKGMPGQTRLVPPDVAQKEFVAKEVPKEDGMVDVISHSSVNPMNIAKKVARPVKAVFTGGKKPRPSQVEH